MVRLFLNYLHEVCKRNKAVLEIGLENVWQEICQFYGRMFGKRFVNFMGGFKSHGDTILKMAERGHYDPKSSEINFAMPDVGVLREYDPYSIEGERKPGVLKDTIVLLAENINKKSACLTFDGKKLKQALTADSGDVDLLGYEHGLSLKEKQEKLGSCITEVNEMVNEIEQLPDLIALWPLSYF